MVYRRRRNKKIDDGKKLDDLPALEGDEEVKERKGLLTQIKSGNNSYKWKNEIKQILYLSDQHNKIMIVTRDPKTFDFDWPKDFNESWKHEIEFIIKSHQSVFSWE